MNGYAEYTESDRQIPAAFNFPRTKLKMCVKPGRSTTGIEY
jgi:hypothetical protein